MKTVLTFVLLGLVSAGFAQVEPTFEVKGDEVKATYFHDNGAIAQQGTFMNGKLDGVWKAYDVNGKKISQGNYTSGEKSGKWFFWQGENLSEVDYSNNAIATVVTYKRATTVVSNNP